MRTLLLMLLIAALAACGSSSTEKSKEQIVQETVDSMNRIKAAEQSFKVFTDEQNKAVETLAQQHREQNKKDREDIAQRTVDLNYVKMNLSNAETELQVQNDKLDNVKGVKLLRTAQEREDQIRLQLSVIQAIRQQIDDLKILMKKIQNGKKYDLAELSEFVGQ